MGTPLQHIAFIAVMKLAKVCGRRYFGRYTEARSIRRDWNIENLVHLGPDTDGFGMQARLVQQAN